MLYPFATMIRKNHEQFQYREHRTVILPSFQGLGIGSRVSDAIGEYLALHGFRLQSKTAHPKYGGYRNKSPLWKATKKNNTMAVRQCWRKHNNNPKKKRLWFCHVYKLPYQRNENDEKFLKSRIIIKRKYEKHWRAIYDPYKKKKNKR